MKTAPTIQQIINLTLMLLIIYSIPSNIRAANNSYNWQTVEQASNQECRGHLQVIFNKIDSDKEKKEIAEYQVLVEQALTYREETIALAKRLKDRIEKDLPLSGKDLDSLNNGTIAHLELRQKLFNIAELHECWLDTSHDMPQVSELSSLTKLQGIMVSLSSALLLYDNYLLAISLFEEDKKLRRFLNERDSGYNKGQLELAKITLSYNSIENRSRVRKAIQFYENNIAQQKFALEQNPDLAYLNLLIQQSPSYNMTKEYSPLLVLGRKLEFMGAISVDTLHNIGNEGTNIFSMLFGNIVGLVESRKGKLYKRPDVLRTVSQQLQAGDILLEKTPFRLTDKFIPGHWGHAAIWIGTEQELKDLGIWDHQLVMQYHKQISGSQLIVEALRSGVEMSTLKKFSNVDDAVVLRDKNASKKERIDIIIQALRQVGKAYDFNFNIETTDRIVCSELVYITHTDIQWPTDKTLGRATISPDNIAEKALDNGPLEIVIFYHDGKLVSHNPVEKMKKLINI